jgi:signal transduction histidine kinase
MKKKETTAKDRAPSAISSRAGMALLAFSLIAITCSTVLFFMLRGQEDQKLALDIRYEAGLQLDIVEKEFTQRIATLYAMAAHVETSSMEDRTKLADYMRRIEPEAASGFVYGVAQRDGTASEPAYRFDGFYGQHAEQIAAASDLLSDPAWQTTFAKAELRSDLAFGRLPLDERYGGGNASIIALPSDDGQQMFFMAIHLSTVFSSAFAGSAAEGVVPHVFMHAGKESEQLIYTSHIEGAEQPQYVQEYQPRGADHQLTVAFRPTEAFVAQHKTMKPFLAMNIGLALTITSLSAFFRLRKKLQESRANAEHQAYLVELLRTENSERKNTEQQLLQAYEDLEQFAETVSHDLKSPLSAMMGHAEYVLLSTNDQLNAEQTDSLQTVVEQGNRLNRMMDDILEQTKSGTIARPIEPVQTSRVVEQIIDGLTGQVETLDARIEIGDLPAVHAHESVLTQVFGNLISNALRYGCQRGGRIEIEGQQLAEKQKTRFYVRDFGPGIPDQEKNKVFSRYHQAANGNRATGFGIGLASVQKIVKKLGGKIWVEDTPGGGATFVAEFG